MEEASSTWCMLKFCYVCPLIVAIQLFAFRRGYPGPEVSFHFSKLLHVYDGAVAHQFTMARKVHNKINVLLDVEDNRFNRIIPTEKTAENGHNGTGWRLRDHHHALLIPLIAGSCGVFHGAMLPIELSFFSAQNCLAVIKCYT
jgi:hypothetical protein